MSPRAPVVLAVPDDDVATALAFAIDEAARHACGLRLVGYDEAMLREVAARVAGVVVEVRVVRGPPVRAVLDASADARLVVVRRRDLLHLIRALTDPDEVIPTTFADPPIACVPPAWVLPVDDRPVAVGIEDTDDAAVMLERAHDLCGAEPLLPIHSSHPRAGDTLVEQSAGSRLLLLGRNQADPRGGTRLGRTARTVLHASACPVVLLPPRGRG